MTGPNKAQYDAWNGDSGRQWATDPDQRDRLLLSVAAALLDTARLPVDSSVLDIGCGCGATTLAVARAVGPAGSALGIDLSQSMLEVARQRVTVAGLTNVTLLQADAQTHSFHPARHDLVISRFGTMFFDNALAAFANIASSLRHGGRLCIATWQSFGANDWLTIPGAALLRFGTLPDMSPTRTGMFAQSEPDHVTGVLAQSGFSGIDVRAVTLPMYLGADPDDATAQLADTGVGRAVLATIPADQHPVALDAVRAVLAEHLGADGIQLNGAVLITTATKPLLRDALPKNAYGKVLKTELRSRLQAAAAAG